MLGEVIGTNALNGKIRDPRFYVNLRVEKGWATIITLKYEGMSYLPKMWLWIMTFSHEGVEHALVGGTKQKIVRKNRISHIKEVGNQPMYHIHSNKTKGKSL